MFKLIIQDDEGKTTIVPLIRDEISIGRKDGNTIRLTERNVSRRHARILRHNGSVVVEDLDSYNGVRVNGNRIQGRVSVAEADRIQIGDYLLELKSDRPQGSGPPGAGGTDQTLQGMGVVGGAIPERAQSDALTAPAIAGMAGGVAMSSMPDMPTVPFDRVDGRVDGRAVARSGVPQVSPSDPTPPSALGAPADATPATALATEPSGKLVVLSTAFAGREFPLDRAAILIGRTDDNDVVINHRSISRHHAQITFDSGRWSIVDKTSTNGVRVNGEDYGKVELRRGDVIELGHVRMRYVEVGEDFVFDGEADDGDDRPLKKKGWVIGLSTLGVVGGVVAILFAMTTGGGGSSTPVAAANHASGTPGNDSAVKPAAMVAPNGPGKPGPDQPAANPDAASAAANPPANPPAPGNPANPPATPGSPQTPTVAKLIGDGNDAISHQQWPAALTAAEQALKIDPQNADAKRIQDQASSEQHNQVSYDRFAQARDGSRTAEAVKIFNEIPTTSVYSAKAARDVDQMHTDWLRDREAEARALVAKKQCDKLPALVKRSADVFPDSKAIVEKAGSPCAATAAVKEPDELSDADLYTLLASAKSEAMKNDWNGVRGTADEILKARPGDQEALKLAGMAACKGGERDRAKRYIGRLKGDQMQKTVKDFCVQNGISFDEPQ